MILGSSPDHVSLNPIIYTYRVRLTRLSQNIHWLGMLLQRVSLISLNLMPESDVTSGFFEPESARSDDRIANTIPAWCKVSNYRNKQAPVDRLVVDGLNNKQEMGNIGEGNQCDYPF